jgi:3-oxoacyl-[acyl-carrier protein] reductase
MSKMRVGLTKRARAIVTGVSHNQGIGAAICRKLAADGADIFFNHRNSAPEWAESFKEEIQEYGVKCKYKDVDLTNSKSATEIFYIVINQLGFLKR